MHQALIHAPPFVYNLRIIACLFCCPVACPLHVDDNLCLVDSVPLLRRIHIRRVSSSSIVGTVKFVYNYEYLVHSVFSFSCSTLLHMRPVCIK